MLERIAGELDRQMQQAEKVDAPFLAFLISQAMDEARRMEAG